jgi:hypothetical protein
VLGHRVCEPNDMNLRQRRNLPTKAGEVISYLVHGIFSEDHTDRGTADTRWVELSDLIEHIGDDVLDAALDDYEVALNATMRTARRELRAERSARQPRPAAQS